MYYCQCENRLLISKINLFKGFANKINRIEFGISLFPITRYDIIVSKDNKWVVDRCNNPNHLFNTFKYSLHLCPLCLSPKLDDEVSSASPGTVA